MRILSKLLFVACLAAVLSAAPSASEAQNCNKNPTHPRCDTSGGGGGDGGDGGDGGGGTTDIPPTYSWMHPDVGLTFSEGLTGAGSHVVIFDNFGGATYRGKLKDGRPETRYHGSWVSLSARLVAPGASFVDVWNSDGSIYNTPGYSDIGTTGDISSVFAATNGVNVVNMSFALLDPANTTVDSNYRFTDGEGNAMPLWDSLVSGAFASNAVYVKAAGNASVAVDDNFTYAFQNVQDSLNHALIGAPGAIFVGALEGNGSTSNPASLASYSMYAGETKAVQDMFLVVGVDSGATRLQGTSFGAPIVAGYAAIIGEKFNAATPDIVVDRLLQTARTDTISGYSVSIHGQGEASLSGALSPDFTPQ